MIQNEQVNVSTSNNTGLENSSKQISDVQKITQLNIDYAKPNQLNSLTQSIVENQVNSSSTFFENSTSLQENQGQKTIDNLKNKQTEVFNSTEYATKDSKIIQNRIIHTTPNANSEEMFSSYDEKKVKLQDFNIKKGFPNFNMNCFLNCSLQVIRQMNYHENNKLLQMSSFGGDLAKMFNNMDQEELIKDDLELLMNNLGNRQKIEKGGDCYSTLLILLSSLKDKNRSTIAYNNFFKLNYEDGIICSQCKLYIQNEKYYNYENKIGCEVNYLDQVFESEIKHPTESIDCCCCCQYNLNCTPQKKFRNSPQYIIARLIKQPKFSYINQNLSKIYHNNGNSYKIIGFVNHYSYHYTYTGLYNGKWIEFNDDSAQEQIPSLKNALIYILKKQ